MCTAVDKRDIIILSDDEDCEKDLSHSESSVLIVEVDDVKKSDCVLPLGSADEDLVVTFSRRAEVLPHARYDCPIHPFTATDQETSSPVTGNQLFCDQCFCYICDKPASTCAMWTVGSVCHCNSHKKSPFWHNLRNCALLGGLKSFNLTLSEIDGHLRHAETMLQVFRTELSVQYSSFVKGKRLILNTQGLPNQEVVVFDYTPVFECVSLFLTKADKLDDRAAAILRLGAAEEFTRHFQMTGAFLLSSPVANAAQAKMILLQSVVASLQRQMVLSDFTTDFIQKLQNFYKKVCCLPELKNMRTSLCVRPWDDILLVSVLKGQNVTGVRKDRGKRDVLNEQMAVVLLRIERLQQQRRYRELCRYLRVVQTDQPKLFQQVQDLIPFFMCLEGDFTSALHGFFPSVNSPASRLTPHLFLLYLHVFKTATAPRLTVGPAAQPCFSEAAWEPVEGAEPMRRAELVRFALRVHRSSLAVYADSGCWVHLLNVVNAPCLPAPSLEFLHDSKAVVTSILQDELGSNVQIPRFFQMVYPDQALLLLVTGALHLRVLQGTLHPLLPVLYTFKENVWALRWLWDSLLSSGSRFSSLLVDIKQEMVKSAEGDDALTFLRSVVQTPSSSESGCDQQPVSR